MPTSFRVRSSVSDETFVFTLSDGTELRVASSIATRSKTIRDALESTNGDDDFISVAPDGFLQSWISVACSSSRALSQMERNLGDDCILLALQV